MAKRRLTGAQIVVGLLGAVTALLAFDGLMGLDPSTPGSVQAAFLPADLHLCDRDWKRGDVRAVRTIELIRQRAGIEPVVVDPRPFAPCPRGPCRNVDIGPCHTVIYVRVAQDGYLDYSLRGGP